MDEVEQEVIRIVSGITKVSAAGISTDTDLRISLNVDSLQGLQIVAALEKRFGIIIPDEDLDSYTTINLIVETVKRHRMTAASHADTKAGH